LNADWAVFDADGEPQYRAVLEGYLVFLRQDAPTASSGRKAKRQRGSTANAGVWFIHILMPDDERRKAYLAGEGFSTSVTLARAQDLALKKVRELREKLEKRG
jgi:hypothetical protein